MFASDDPTSLYDLATESTPMTRKAKSLQTTLKPTAYKVKPSGTIPEDFIHERNIKPLKFLKQTTGKVGIDFIVDSTFSSQRKSAVEQQPGSIAQLTVQVIKLAQAIQRLEAAVGESTHEIKVLRSELQEQDDIFSAVESGAARGLAPLAEYSEAIRLGNKMMGNVLQVLSRGKSDGHQS